VSCWCTSLPIADLVILVIVSAFIVHVSQLKLRKKIVSSSMCAKIKVFLKAATVDPILIKRWHRRPDVDTSVHLRFHMISCFSFPACSTLVLVLGWLRKKEGKLVIVHQVGFSVGMDDTNSVETDFICVDCVYKPITFSYITIRTEVPVSLHDMLILHLFTLLME